LLSGTPHPRPLRQGREGSLRARRSVRGRRGRSGTGWPGCPDERGKRSYVDRGSARLGRSVGRRRARPRGAFRNS